MGRLLHTLPQVRISSHSPSARASHTLLQSELLTPALNQGSLTRSLSQDSSHPPPSVRAPHPGLPHTLPHPGLPHTPPHPGLLSLPSPLYIYIYIYVVSHFGLRCVLVAGRRSSSGCLQGTCLMAVALQAQWVWRVRMCSAGFVAPRYARVWC